MKVQEGSSLKHINFRIFRSTIGFSVDQTYQKIGILNEWSPTGKFRKVDKFLGKILHMKSN